MTNESIPLEWKDEDVWWFTVADGAAITKGTHMNLSTDPRTVVAMGTTVNTGKWVGIAIEDKEANSGRTVIGVLRGGVVDIVDSGSGITVGEFVFTSGTANCVKSETFASLSDGAAKRLVGMALETASASEMIMVALTRLKG